MTETIVAVATPPGESALAILRLSGDHCSKITLSCFDTPSPIPRHSYVSEYRNSAGDSIDQVVWCFYPSGKSFTGEEMLEISCHGNEFIIKEIINDLLSFDIRAAEPGEFTKRAFLSKKIDLTQAEAIAQLISAQSTREAKLSKKNLEGNLSEKILIIQQNILGIVSKIEAFIDFPEDDIGERQSDILISQIADIEFFTKTLADAYHRNSSLISKRKVVLIGSPNAGKSTLFNCIVGYDRSIISTTPGTTRDYISQEIIINDSKIDLIDTAGLRDTKEKIESTGVDNTVKLLEKADVIILVLDVSLPYPSCISQYTKNNLKSEKLIIVENKNDLNRKISTKNYPQNFKTVNISAKDNKGINCLLDEFNNCIMSQNNSDNNVDILINLRQYNCLSNACEYFVKARAILVDCDDYLLASIELNEALIQIGEIIGHTDNEDMLDKLFKNFCIGK